VEVSYVGFLTEKQELRVGANTPATVEVRLNLAPSVADEITVSASRPRGEVEALNQRKSAVNIVDILPAGRTGTARLQRTTPNAANFGITYDKGGLAFRAAATDNSATIFFYNFQDGADGGLEGPNGDTYLYPHTQIALISYTMPGGYQFFVTGLNLNNEVFGFYNGSPEWNIQREFYNRTYSAGVRVIR